MENYLLSKSRYLSGLQCHKKLWREVNKPDSVGELTLAERQRIDTGKEIGKLARLRFPDGILINSLDPIEQTQQVIEQKPIAIFEPAFIFNDLLVRVDILKNNNDGTWDIFEVKSGTTAKEEYIADAAIQYYCLKGCGILIRTIHVMHINNGCVYPDFSNLFSTVDVTVDVKALQSDIGVEVAIQLGMLSSTEPSIPIGKHCGDCQYKTECWSDVPKHSIFTIPRFQSKKCDELVAAGIYGIDQLPASTKLTDIQKQYVDNVRQGGSSVNVAGISSALARLQYPLYFFDFETDNSAIPRFDGCSPYSQYPFQYSLHILTQDGKLSHKEYLHTDLSDPRQVLTERMVNDMDSTGHIVVYNASFERQVITNLIKWCPDLADQLNAILGRFVDQLPIVRDNIKHPDFFGSYSIKSVLPVLIPDLSYDQLDEVHDGLEAGAAWNIAIREDDAPKRESTFTNLKAYCRLDTMAMVRIHQYLSNISKLSPGNSFPNC
jgi:hypothetical protein